MLEKATEILRKYWGHTTLHPTQQCAIESILNGNDTLVIMPTGGGKSICYQLPAIMCEGLTIVVSPLIALMEDQVKALRDRNIPARYINSSLSSSQISQYMEEALSGEIKLLYITPERILSESFTQIAQYINVSILAVDEAHCISAWGHDFRPSYRYIAELKKIFPYAPTMALTATATKEVEDDIVKNLSFSSGYKKIKQSFRRDNLSYQVRLSTHRNSELLEMLRKCQGSAIVYCGTKNSIFEIDKMLNANDISSCGYHAGLSNAIRSKALKQWLSGEKKVMVATSAFGMGIDKADVRLVIHYHIPLSPEDYFQQAGRAGRDGLPATAVILADEKTINTLMYFSQSEEPKDEIYDLYIRLCNYYNVGYGDFPSSPFNFSFEEFIKRYKITDATHLRTLFSYLVRYGIISFFGTETLMAKTMIRVSPEECYQMNENSDTRTLEALVRSSDGIFGYMCRIDLELLAGNAQMTVEDFKNSLSSLQKRGIIDYTTAGKYNLLSFNAQRDDKYIKSLIFSSAKRAENQRKTGAKDMIDYIYSTSCRAQWIEEYFGDKENTPCIICDNCLNTNHYGQD